MATEYQEAPEVKKIATMLIDSDHPHLMGARVEYVFVSPTPKSKNKDIWGRARKITGLPAWLSTEPTFRDNVPDPFFVIEISKEIWDAIPSEQKLALVDHELSHCGYDDEKDCITTMSHDVEEFTGIVKRHGLWRSDVKRFVEVARDNAKSPLFKGVESIEFSSGDCETVVKLERGANGNFQKTKSE
jgi:hypothetical protein